ncbi:unnamed protein product [Paramecium octaurelia]|uniref:Uncharacterized protein n=1 Tax=Paramecium octaurelia TaxID=43137 RepID=A0A8S1SJJ4_PAROT|nr:unnamed protein product [Paramecium octaurelia]
MLFQHLVVLFLAYISQKDFQQSLFINYSSNQKRRSQNQTSLKSTFTYDLGDTFSNLVSLEMEKGLEKWQDDETQNRGFALANPKFDMHTRLYLKSEIQTRVNRFYGTRQINQSLQSL